MRNLYDRDRKRSLVTECLLENIPIDVLGGYLTLGDASTSLTFAEVVGVVCEDVKTIVAAGSYDGRGIARLLVRAVGIAVLAARVSWFGAGRAKPL
jgi:hypothetical protein